MTVANERFRSDPALQDAAVVLEVAIGPGPAPGRFKVDIVDSPAGLASTVVDLDAAGLAARRAELQLTVLASAVADRRLMPDTEDRVREVGTVLFQALLGAADISGVYRASVAIAADREQALRIVLRIDTAELAGLPWEAMYDGANGAYVCRSDQLVRHVPVATVLPALPIQPPLRILGLISSPRGLPLLDAQRERDLLTGALADPVRDGLAEIYWSPISTWSGLHDLLIRGRWHVLHFIGHGDFDADQDEGVLALTREDGRADLVEAQRFADLLRQARPMPRLVVLNSCSGGATSSSDLFSGTAAALARSGITAVAAMQYRISDAASAAFARGFYTAIAHGRGIDDAVSSGRIAILGTASHTLEWLTPVLYLRGHHAKFFTRSTTMPDRAQLPANAASPAATIGNQPGQARATRPDDIPGTSAEPTIVRSEARRRVTSTAPSRPIRTLTGHSRAAWGVAFSPDGALVATASHDKTARLWSAADGTLIHILTGHAGPVVRIAFSPDGALIATASFDGTARLWSAADGTHTRTLAGHDGFVWDTAFSPDGRLVATVSQDRTTRLWTRSDGTHRLTFSGPGRIAGVAFSPDGALLATANDDQRAQMWNLPEGTPARTFSPNAGPVWAVAFSPDSTLLATANDNATVQLWDIANGAAVHTLTGHTGAVVALAFSPDGTLLATASHDGTARIWNTSAGTPAKILSGHTGPVWGVAFSPDGSHLATTSFDRTARLWE